MATSRCCLCLPARPASAAPASRTCCRTAARWRARCAAAGRLGARGAALRTACCAVLGGATPPLAASACARHRPLAQLGAKLPCRPCLPSSPWLQVFQDIVGSLPSGTPVMRPHSLSSSLHHGTPLQQPAFGRSPVLQVPAPPEQPAHATPGFGFMSPLAGERRRPAGGCAAAAGRAPAPRPAACSASRIGRGCNRAPPPAAPRRREAAAGVVAPAADPSAAAGAAAAVVLAAAGRHAAGPPQQLTRPGHDDGGDAGSAHARRRAGHAGAGAAACRHPARAVHHRG
jgi:hypothetical protein